MDYLVTDLRLKNEKIMVSLEGAGSFFLDPHIIFPSHIQGTNGSGKQKIKTLEEKIKNDEVLKQFKTRVTNNFYDILQIRAPMSLSKRLVEKTKKNGTKQFVTGNYLKQLRWSYIRVGDSLELTEDQSKLFETKREMEIELDEIDNKIETIINESYTKLKNKIDSKNDEEQKPHKAQITRNKNVLEEIISKNKTEEEILNEAEQKIKKIPLEIVKQKYNLHQRIKQEGMEIIEYNSDDHSTKHILNLEFRQEDLKVKKIEERIGENKIYKNKLIDAKELFYKKWCLFDTENPLFRKGGKTNWIGLIGMEGYKILEKIIITPYELDTKEVNGYKIIKTKEEDVFKVASEIMRKYKVLTAYNAPYDLGEGKKSNDMLIGDYTTNVKSEVNIDFFKRSKIYGKIIIDPLNWARTEFAYLPNKKLETVMKHLGINFSKSIDYRQMEELELIAKNGKVENTSEDVKELIKNRYQEGMKIETLAALLIAEYLSKDINAMEEMRENNLCKWGLIDTHQICEKFGLEYARAIFSPNAINEAKEKKYFNETGIYREEIIRKTKKNMQEEQEALEYIKNKITNGVKGKTKIGIHEQVYKIFLPIGDYLSNLVRRGFPKAKELYDYKAGIKDNTNRQFMLSQFSNALARDILVDYSKATNLEKKYHTFIKKHFLTSEECKDLEEHPGRIWCKRVEEMYKKFTILFQEPIESYGNMPEIKRLQKQKFSITRLNKYLEKNYNTTRLNNIKEEIKQYIDNLPGDSSHKRSGFFKKFINLHAGLENKLKWIMGNYKIDYTWIKDEIDQNIRTVNNIIEKNNIEVLLKRGQYIYVKANEEGLNRLQDRYGYGYNLTMNVDNVDKLLIAKSKGNDAILYFRKYGKLIGVPEDDQPRYLFNLYEMKNYKPLIESMIDGEFEKAKQKIEEIKIEMDRIDKKDLLFFSKNKKIYSGFDCRFNERIKFFDPSDLCFENEKYHYYKMQKGKKTKIESIYDKEKKIHYFISRKLTKEKWYVAEDGIAQEEHGRYFNKDEVTYDQKRQNYKFYDETNDENLTSEYDDEKKLHYFVLKKENKIHTYVMKKEDFMPAREMYKERMIEQLEAFEKTLKKCEEQDEIK